MQRLPFFDAEIEWQRVVIWGDGNPTRAAKTRGKLF
jgi:hypothetical protein